METVGSFWMWAGFAAVVAAMLAIDLFVVGGGKRHRVSMREAATWSAVWVAVALAFAGVLWWHLDATAGRAVANETALEYLTGYLIEKSLAVDNVFVWLMLFTFFAVPAELQKRVLVYGVIGAIAMRTVMIFAGAWLIAQFHWILYLFGALLLVTGVKMWWFADEKPDLEANPIIRWIRRHMRVTTVFEGERFFVAREEGGRLVRYATPLFLVLVLVETTDLVFAVDSIPAIFAVTRDPFIVFSSNIFAILGLRSLYFVLAGAMSSFHYLKAGLSLVLVFIGIKMLIADMVHIPITVSLGMVLSILALSVIASLLRTRRSLRREQP